MRRTLITLPTQLHDLPAPSHHFRGLGDLPGGIVDSVADSVSADGTVVVGTSNSAAGQEAFRWTPDGGMVGLELSHATDVSADGTTAVGFARHSHPARWTQRGGVEGLGNLPGLDYGEALGVSADGSVIVGRCEALSGGGHVPVIWTQRRGMAHLGPLPDAVRSAEARAISADSKVVVGELRHESGTREAFRWTAESGIVGLGVLPGHKHSVAHAVSGDGSVVVGGSESSGARAFRWTRETGMTDLGPPTSGRCDSRAFGVSANGSVVVGQWCPGSKLEAFVWDTTRGMRSLSELIESRSDLDATRAGWRLMVAKSVSHDGIVVVGTGLNPSGDREGWIAYLGKKPATAH
jgi:probable HAF family extracellular repeat protein